MKTYKLLITGKVQGVWYRASAKDKAISLGLRGRVWNQPDGSVAAIAQGSVENIFEFVQWCKQGPELAIVQNVVVSEENADEIFTSFEITKA